MNLIKKVFIYKVPITVLKFIRESYFTVNAKNFQYYTRPLKKKEKSYFLQVLPSRFSLSHDITELIVPH